MTLVQILTDIYKSVALNLRTLKNNWRLSLIIVFIIFCGPILSVIYIPYQTSGGWIVFSVVIIPVLTLLGWLTYTFRNSTIYLVYSSYGGNKIVFYMSQIILIFILANIFAFIGGLFLFAFGKWGILSKKFVFNGGGRYPVGTNIFQNFTVFFIGLYIVNVSALLSFSIYYLLHNFISNLKNYYIIVMILLVLGVIFGGTLNSFFNYSSILPETSNTQYMDFKSSETNAYVLFPKSMFWVSLIIMPFYGVGQQFTVGFTEIETFAITVSNQHAFFLMGFNQYLYHWTIVMLHPFIWIVLSFLIGSSNSLIKKIF